MRHSPWTAAQPASRSHSLAYSFVHNRQPLRTGREPDAVGGRRFHSLCHRASALARTHGAVDHDAALEATRPRVPDVLPLDTYKQRAWVTVTPFWINHLRPPGVPSLPWLSHLSEINVRTYVTYDGKPGVYFFSLDASNLSAVWGARVFYRLPYWQA